MYDSLKRFELKYGHLKKVGLQINGLALADAQKKKHVIDISRPLIFDNRLLPKRFEGMDLRCKIHGTLPFEFQIDRTQPDWHKMEYIWSPERFEKFVDRCAAEIREVFKNPEMERGDMLDALCFGNFLEHKLKCENLIKEGKIPAYKEVVTA